MLVTFDAKSGEARELPREFVPDAFREWDLSVRDWQTQCSMHARGEDLEYRVRRLLPSVGCEADATAFVDEAVVGNSRASSPSSSSPSSDSNQESLLLSTAPDGGYALVPPRLSTKEGELTRVEACLPLSERAPGGGRRRLRLVLFAAAAAAPPSGGSPPSPPPASLETVEVHSETFDSPYCVSGATLSGCGGSVPQFSSKARTAAEELDGGALSWAPVVVATGAEGGGGGDAAAATSRAFICKSSTSLSPSLSPPPARKARGGPQGRLLLQLGSWATLRPSAAPEGGVVFEAGVLLPSSPGGDDSSSSSPSPRRRKVVTAAYSGDGKLTGVLLATEEAVVVGGGEAS